MVKTIKAYLQQYDLEGEVDFRGGHCFGSCHLGPVVEFDGVIYEKMNEQKLLQLLDEKLNRST